MSTSYFDLTEKTALVTGASSGLGEHFAKVLAEHGAKVVVAARRRDKLNTLVKSITDTGGSALAIELDVTDEESVRTSFDKAEEVFGTINIVSNNAGIADARPALEIDKESWDKVINTNLNGVWMIGMEAAKRMVKANLPGSIVNTASILGLRVATGQSSYATSKAGVVQLSKGLALEWARYGIRVNALCPGYFITEMNKEYFDSDHGKKYIKRSPSRRTGKLSELTVPFLLLASDAGSFISGVALPVDGAHSVGDV